MATAALGALALTVLAPAARADIVFFDGAGGVQPDQNVLLPSGQSGTTIIGLTNNTQTQVLFSQPTLPETLNTNANGQARIVAADGAFTSLRTQLGGNFTFTQFEANPNFLNGGVPFTVRVVENNGDVSTRTFTSGNGNSFFGVQAINNQRISFIDITGATNSLQDVRQVRIGGIAAPAAVPEPGIVAFATVNGLGMAGMVFRARRRTGKRSTNVVA